MVRIPVGYRDSGYGKGVGMFSPCDIAAGDLIFSEIGWQYPFEEFSRPWKTEAQFSHQIQKIHDFMQLVKSTTENLADGEKGTTAGLDYPQDMEACFMRPVNDNTYSMDTICQALYGWISQSIPEETQGYAATLVARFLEDCIQYIKYGSSRGVVSVFGLLTGLINHACSPNAVLRVEDVGQVQLQDDTPPKLVVVNLTVCKTVRKGDEITVSYIWGVSPGAGHHRAELLHNYKFQCKCDSCFRECHANSLSGARDAVYELLYELKQARDGLLVFPLQLTCNMTRWIIDGSEELNYFNPEILEALHSCFMYNVDIDDHLRASYFFRAKLEMIKTYLSSEDRAYVDAEARFRDTYTEWNAPEVCELSQRLYYIDDNDVIDKIYMLKPNLNDNAFTKREKNDECRAIVFAFRNINKTIRSTKEALDKERLKRASKATNGATNECCPLHVLADVALEDSTVAAKRQLKPDTGSKQDRPMKQELRALKVKNEIARVEAAKKKKRKSAVARSRRVQHRKFDDDALPVVSGDEDLATESATALRESCAYHVGEVVMDEMNEVAAVESDKAASLSLPAALNSVSGVEYAWSSLWVSSFAAKDSLSKQAWCSSQLLQEMMPFAPRDVEHLLASKDGLGSKNDGFGLKMRRDSCCGRVEGTKKFLDLEEVFGARKRAHTFGNDAGKKDLLKEVEV